MLNKSLLGLLKKYVNICLEDHQERIQVKIVEQTLGELSKRTSSEVPKKNYKRNNSMALPNKWTTFKTYTKSYILNANSMFNSIRFNYIEHFPRLESQGLLDKFAEDPNRVLKAYLNFCTKRSTAGQNYISTHILSIHIE